MANRFVTLNAVTLYPSFPIICRYPDVGTFRRARSGRGRQFLVAEKREWELPWTNAPESTFLTVNALYAIKTTMVFVDQFGTSAMVLIDRTDNPLEQALEFIDLANIGYYSFTLTLLEV